MPPSAIPHLQSCRQYTETMSQASRLPLCCLQINSSTEQITQFTTHADTFVLTLIFRSHVGQHLASFTTSNLNHLSQSLMQRHLISSTQTSIMSPIYMLLLSISLLCLLTHRSRQCTTFTFSTLNSISFMNFKSLSELSPALQASTGTRMLVGYMRSPYASAAGLLHTPGRMSAFGLFAVYVRSLSWRQEFFTKRKASKASYEY